MNLLLHQCLAGVDDGFFVKKTIRADRPKTILSMAIMCKSSSNLLIPAHIVSSIITVDGMESTDKIINLYYSVPPLYKPSVILMDTPIFAGFNIADPRKISEETSTPIIVVHLYPPDKKRIESALKKHFKDYETRLSILRDEWQKLRKISCRLGHVYIAVYGASLDYAWRTVCASQVFSREPEPLYLAGMVASTISRRLIYKNHIE